MAVWLLAFLFAAATAPAGLPAQEALSYRLKWLVNISTAGDVFAVEQGWFAREALDVEVKAGGPERDAIRELELG